MTRIRKRSVAGLCGVAAVLLFSAQVGSAKTESNTLKAIGQPVWALAMDGPRVAYVSGNRPGSESIHVWNLATGATSSVNGGPHGFAAHLAADIAISGKRVVWVRGQQVGNTELNHWLYTAPVGGSAHLLKRVHGYTGTDCGLGGPQLGGLAGSANAVVVNTWNAGSDGSTHSNERLAVVTPTRLRTIATGADAILSESVDAGHIAVVPVPTANVTPDGCTTPLPTSVLVYSTTGALLQTIALPAPDPSALGYQVAISGSRLVVLTIGLHEPSGPAWVTLGVYNWTTGALLHTWPVDIPKYPGEVNFSFHGNLAAVEGPYRLHLVDLETGNDVKIAPGSGTGAATSLGPRGLVYAVNPDNRGKLVFVPTAKLRRLVG